MKSAHKRFTQSFRFGTAEAVMLLVLFAVVMVFIEAEAAFASV